MKKLLTLLLLTVCMACHHTKEYQTVHCLDLSICVEELGNDNYRIHLSNLDEPDGEGDWIDVNYHPSEMPSITLYFPIDNPKKIYVADRWQEVQDYIGGKRFRIQNCTISDNTFAWTDSTMFRTPCVKVEFGPDRIFNMRVSDENGQVIYN